MADDPWKEVLVAATENEPEQDDDRADAFQYLLERSGRVPTTVFQPLSEPTPAIALVLGKIDGIRPALRLVGGAARQAGWRWAGPSVPIHRKRPLAAQLYRQGSRTVEWANPTTTLEDCQSGDAEFSTACSCTKTFITIRSLMPNGCQIDERSGDHQ